MTPGKSDVRTTRRGARPYVLVYLGNVDGIPHDAKAAQSPAIAKDKLWCQLAEEFGASAPLQLLPAYRVDPARMRRIVERATAAAKKRGLESYRPLAFDHYFVVPLPESARRPVFDLYCGLKRWAESRNGYAYFSMPTRAPAGSDAYLGPGNQPAPAPAGIGAQDLHGTNNTRLDGNGQRLVSIEKGWLYPALDTNAPRIPLLAVEMVDSLQDEDLGHGAAILGIVRGGAGVSTLAGIAPGASVQRAPYLDQNGIDFAADAIYAAADALDTAGGAGGVILLEAQTWDGSPLETDPFTLKAIQDAYLLDQIVIEPAGNREPDIDGNAGADLAAVDGYQLDPNDPNGAPIPRALDGTAGRSPAILVAAGRSGNVPATPRGERTPESNFGALIDAWAWGDAIRTLWYEIVPLTGERRPIEHPLGFGGTSGAAAIVAGAVVLMQAARANSGRALLGPDQVRRMLADFGTRGAGELAGKRMPDLGAMLAALEAAP